MKRIPNKTAVATICYGISGLQDIIIVDYKSEYDLLNGRNGEVVCSGQVKDLLYDYKYSKWFESEYRGMSIVDGVIVFQTFTKWEEYK